MIRSCFLLVAVGLCAAAAFMTAPTFAGIHVAKFDPIPAVAIGAGIGLIGMAAFVAKRSTPIVSRSATPRYDDNYWIDAAPLASRLEVGTRPKGA